MGEETKQKLKKNFKNYTKNSYDNRVILVD